MPIGSDRAPVDEPSGPTLVPFPNQVSALLARDPAAALGALDQALRAPLTALAATSAQLLEDRAHLDAPQVRALVATLRCQALGLQALVETVLCATALQAGRLRLRRRPVPLGAVVDEVRPRVEPLLGQRRQALRLRRAPALPAVCADPRRLGQALEALILSASQRAAAGQTIQVAFAVRGDRVRGTVSARGPDRPRGRAGHRGEPRDGAPPVAPPGGEAEDRLRLAMARAIVEAHGGAMGSEPGRRAGTRLWFALPGEPSGGGVHPGPAGGS